WVDKTKKEKAWLIIMVHHVSNDTDKEYNITPHDLTELIDYIIEQDIEIKTVSEVISIWKIDSKD
ncbi:MAG: hypothetical protein U9O53_04090, partial [archaeon]|nr:hypothetical protein [archaeon]